MVKGACAGPEPLEDTICPGMPVPGYMDSLETAYSYYSHEVLKEKLCYEACEMFTRHNNLVTGCQFNFRGDKRESRAFKNPLPEDCVYFTREITRVIPIRDHLWAQRHSCWVIPPREVGPSYTEIRPVHYTTYQENPDGSDCPPIAARAGEQANYALRFGCVPTASSDYSWFALQLPENTGFGLSIKRIEIDVRHFDDEDFALKVCPEDLPLF